MLKSISPVFHGTSPLHGHLDLTDEGLSSSIQHAADLLASHAPSSQS